MRRATLTLIYEGHDISQDIAPGLLSFSFTEKADGESDDVQIEISDRDRKWQETWIPQRGHTMRPSIVCRNWFEDGDMLTLDCGLFQVDEVEFSFDEIDKVTIKGIPGAVKPSIVGQKKTTGWQDRTLEQIAGDIAARGGLSLVYKGSTVPFSRIEQRQEPDLAFLSRLGTENGFRVKAADGKLIVIEGKLADAMSPLELNRQLGSSFRVRIKSEGVYKGSKETYHDPQTGNLYESIKHDPNDPQTGKYLELNMRTENLAAAHRVSSAKLREKNAGQIEGDWESIGDPRVRAGITLKTAGFGKLSETTFTVDEATHSITKSDGYRLSAKLKTALEY